MVTIIIVLIINTVVIIESSVFVYSFLYTRRFSKHPPWRTLYRTNFKMNGGSSGRTWTSAWWYPDPYNFTSPLCTCRDTSAALVWPVKLARNLVRGVRIKLRIKSRYDNVVTEKSMCLYCILFCCNLGAIATVMNRKALREKVSVSRHGRVLISSLQYGIDGSEGSDWLLGCCCSG